MTIEVRRQGVLADASDILLNTDARVGISGLSAAADGTGSQGGITFDDPNGDMVHRGWEIIKVDETDCVGATTLFYGTSADRTERRGPYRDGPGREIDMTINDHNGFLSLHIAGGDTASRPSETDIARLDWLINDSGLLDDLVFDLGFVNAVGRVVDAANLQGMYPAEIISELATGDEIFFTYWDQAEEKVGLFFDSPGATTWTSTLSISNDLSDVDDDTVFAPMLDDEANWDPSNVNSRIRFKYATSAVWRTRAATSSAFFPSPLNYRSFQVEMDKVGLLSTAITFADRLLERDSKERVVVKFTVRLPSTHVGLIQAGMRIALRFTHLTGFTGALGTTYSRVERLNAVPTQFTPRSWDVTLECSTFGARSVGGGTGGGSTDPFPYDPPPPAVPTEFCCTQLVAGAGASDIRAEAPYRFTVPDGHSVSIHIASFSITGTLPTSDWVGMSIAYSWNGGTVFYGAVTSENYGAGGPSTQNMCWNGGSLSACVGTESGSPPTFPTVIGGAPPGVDNTFEIWGITGLSGSTATVTFCLTVGNVYDVDSGLLLGNEVPTAETTTDAPDAGKPVGPETVTMSGADGTTAYPFAAGSLRVFVDNLDQTAAITAQDGTAKTFTLGFIPKAGEVVTVYYVAA